MKKAAAAGRAPSERARTLCFRCYRAELDRDQALKAASACGPRGSTGSPRPELVEGREESESAPAARLENAFTAEDQRWQWQLPFEPVNRPRLEMLKAERATERATLREGAGRFADRRRQAQIAARHALQRIAAGLQARQLSADDRALEAMAAAIHAAELQLPESWLPFVVSR